jgi:hypothetical protein
VKKDKYKGITGDESAGPRPLRAKNAGGRRPKADADKRFPVTIYLTKSEITKLTTGANKADTTVSDFGRRKLREVKAI